MMMKVALVIWVVVGPGGGREWWGGENGRDRVNRVVDVAEEMFLFDTEICKAAKRVPRCFH